MKFIQSSLFRPLVSSAAPLIGALASFQSQALTVDATQAPIVGGFHYEFTIDNSAGPNEIAIVSLNAPLGDALIGATLDAPAGFAKDYDGGLGLVSFIGDTSFFAVGTVTSGFSFDSSGFPPQYFSTFTALDIAGTEITGTINFNAVPEAGNTLLPACAAIVALAFIQRKSSSSLYAHGS
jgi:hypothetical protein